MSRISHSGTKLTRADMGAPYLPLNTSSVGAGYDMADGWHYIHLRRQGDIAGTVFEPQVFNAQRGYGAVNMSRARAVWVDERARFYACE